MQAPKLVVLLQRVAMHPGPCAVPNYQGVYKEFAEYGKERVDGYDGVVSPGLASILIVHCGDHCIQCKLRGL